tara:strand:+ start:258 stop:524 length:267 start_codon:yes stop_codon:yes gene_type:complete
MITRVWGDDYTIRHQDVLINFPGLKYQLLDFGLKETIAIIPREVGGKCLERLLEIFGTAYSESHINDVYYLAISHRNDNEIKSYISNC